MTNANFHNRFTKWLSKAEYNPNINDTIWIMKSIRTTIAKIGNNTKYEMTYDRCMIQIHETLGKELLISFEVFVFV